MAAAPAGDNLNKIVIFSPGTGLSFQYVRWRSGDVMDMDRIASSESFASLSFPEGSIVRLMLSSAINDPDEAAVVAYGKVRDSDAYVYAEIADGIFDVLIGPGPGNTYIVSEDESYPEAIPEHLLDERSWATLEYELAIPGCRVVHFMDKAPLGLASAYGLAVFICILIASALLFIFLSVFLSRYLTRTSTRLVRHIRYLMDTGNFGYTDKSIEEGNDEMADIGRTVNEMSVFISNLLKRNEALFDEKRKMEISMLQMQVNPHFLYNTLESMHYLAEVQRNSGIAKMSRGLSTLLRNLAKGSNDRIPLREELSLLRDYDEIQQVRYMGMYEISYDIPDEAMDILIQKFTLQPLVENAVFHGIEPSGHCGTIKIDANVEDGILSISVTDDGVGMTRDEIDHIFDDRKHSKTDMTGVGVRNINDRIRLFYGEEYGLSFDSEKGRYTRATVRIKAERDNGIQSADCR